MRTYIQSLIAITLLATLLLFGCTEEEITGPDLDDFDRSEMLANWADNIIIPSYAKLSEDLDSLERRSEDFNIATNQQSLNRLRDAYITAYSSWQHVSMFTTGPAEMMRYRDQMNIYPTDVAGIRDNISSGSYNLELPSENIKQGFPAVDYLLFGLGSSDGDIIALYSTDANADARQQYLADVIGRMESLTNSVLAEWRGGYRDQFVAADGNDANASVDMLVNDFLQYYEKNLRAGKVGIPAGVFATSGPLDTHVEGYHSRIYSKQLLLESITAVRSFFNGEDFSTGADGTGLADYLAFLETEKDGNMLGSMIDTQFETARQQADNLQADFRDQINSDNTAMLATYDALQRNVVLMKVDMLQALNINVTYVDADGD